MYCRCRRNPDEHMRSLERAALRGDPDARIRLLRWRMGAGQLNPQHVQLAAELGHPLAIQLVEPATQIHWGGRNRKHRYDFFNRLIAIDGRYLTVKITCSLAERVLPIFENAYPNDRRPREAIEAARRWADDPTEQNRINAANARARADGAARGDVAQPAEDDVMMLGWSSWSQSFVRTAVGAARPACAAADAAILATDAAAADAATYAVAYAADYTNINLNIAYQWQSNFIAEVLLGLQKV